MVGPQVVRLRDRANVLRWPKALTLEDASMLVGDALTRSLG
jgi:hypothetical protein